MKTNKKKPFEILPEDRLALIECIVCVKRIKIKFKPTNESAKWNIYVFWLETETATSTTIKYKIISNSRRNKKYTKYYTKKTLKYKKNASMLLLYLLWI